MQSQTALFNSHVDPARERRVFLTLTSKCILWTLSDSSITLRLWCRGGTPVSCLRRRRSKERAGCWTTSDLSSVNSYSLHQHNATPHPHPHPPRHLPSSPQSCSRRRAPSLASPLSALRHRRGFQPNLSARLSSASCSCSWNETCKYAPASPPS